MEPIVIRVRGLHVSQHTPERGTLSLVVSHQAATAEAAYERTAADLVRVQTSLTPHLSPTSAEHAPSARDLHVGQITTSWHRPWGPDGEQGAAVFACSAWLSVEFADFVALSAWLRGTAAVDAVSVQHVAWSLTDETLKAAERAGRGYAVQDARGRAQDLADAAGAGEPVLRSLSEGELAAGLPDAGFFKADAVRSGDGVELTPEKLTVRISVQAEYLAEVSDSSP